MDINHLKNPREVENLARSIDAAHIGHELVLFDNIEHHTGNLDSANAFVLNPVKVVGASIFLCKRGWFTCRINLADYVAREGDAVVVLPGSIMQIIDVSDDVLMATLSFATDYFESIVDVSAGMRDSPVVTLPQSDFAECMTAYSWLDSRLRLNGRLYSRVIAKGYIGVICGIVFDAWKNLPDATAMERSRPAELYMRYLAKVQEDYHCHRSVKYYADVLCVSPKYLSMVVKKESGRNASDFIDELVIFEAKALLATGDYTVQQVAGMMEFPNPSFFSRFFRRRTGLSPATYRKFHRSSRLESALMD